MAQEVGSQVVSGGTARVPQAVETLAAYGLAWGVVTFLVAILIQTRQLGLVLVDGKFPLAIQTPQKTIVKGDSRCASIAAASIIAKVARDRFMIEQESLYPSFSFSQHKGYGTPKHLKELEKFGPTELHRQSFSPVKNQRQIKHAL